MIQGHNFGRRLWKENQNYKLQPPNFPMPKFAGCVHDTTITTCFSVEQADGLIQDENAIATFAWVGQAIQRTLSGVTRKVIPKPP
jgi:hypothetical protein